MTDQSKLLSMNSNAKVFCDIIGRSYFTVTRFTEAVFLTYNSVPFTIHTSGILFYHHFIHKMLLFPQIFFFLCNIGIISKHWNKTDFPMVTT